MTAFETVQLLQNTDFKQTDYKGKRWFQIAATTGWKSSGGHRLELGFGNVYNSNWEPETRVAELDSTGNHDLVSEVDIPAGLYTLRFRYAARMGRVNGNTFRVLLDGVEIHHFKPTDVLVHVYTKQVVVHNENAKLVFTGDGLNDSYGATVTDITLTTREFTEDIFFQEFEELPGYQSDEEYSDEHFDLHEQELLEAEEGETITVETVVHDPFFKKHSIDPEHIIQLSSWNMPNFTEEYVTDVHSSLLHKFLKVYSTKADKWCFIRIGDKEHDHFTFFFECSKNLVGKAFFRKLTEDCPYPTIKPIPPVIEEICYMQMKKASDMVEFTFDAYGEGNSEAIIHCYVTVLKKVKKGDVETMCTVDAVVDGWEALTQRKLDDLEATSESSTANDNEGKNYEFETVETTEKFDAQ